MLNADMTPNLRTAQVKDQVNLDYDYWAKNGEAMSAQWNEWLLK